MNLNTNQIKLQSIINLCTNVSKADVLRLDLIHPIVSGNKWFKLKYQIEEAITSKQSTIATFGGAYSNHIVATAFACKAFGINSIGYIRGEEPKSLSHTLQKAVEFGMQLKFISRTDFNQKEKIKLSDNAFYWIEEGGYSILGAKGASEILQQVDTSEYSHILCSCGTGTMMAGLIDGSLLNQTIIGLSALKGNFNLEEDVLRISQTTSVKKSFKSIHDYHFGGYAKHPEELIKFMNEVYEKTQLPTDIIYTSKLIYGVIDLCKKKYFHNESKLLIIHSGGLQGNLSLPKGTLVF
jgi:1-aminocyclopropane-1-carboxylate deaminase